MNMRGNTLSAGAASAALLFGANVAPSQAKTAPVTPSQAETAPVILNTPLSESIMEVAQAITAASVMQTGEMGASAKISLPFHETGYISVSSDTRAPGQPANGMPDPRTVNYINVGIYARTPFTKPGMRPTAVESVALMRRKDGSWNAYTQQARLLSPLVVEYGEETGEQRTETELVATLPKKNDPTTIVHESEGRTVSLNPGRAETFLGKATLRASELIHTILADRPLKFTGDLATQMRQPKWAKDLRTNPLTDK